MKWESLALAITLVVGSVILLTGCDSDTAKSERRLAFEERYPECFWVGHRWECAQVIELRRIADLLEGKQ